MTKEEIQRRLNVIRTFQDKWGDEEVKLQKLCEHPDLTVKHDSNTGNYDPTVDSYWTNYHCCDCDARWTEFE